MQKVDIVLIKLVKRCILYLGLNINLRNMKKNQIVMSLAALSVIMLTGAGCVNQKYSMYPEKTNVDNNTSPSTTQTDVGQKTAVVISKLSPVSGKVNTEVTITGSGFLPKDNLVMFGDSTGRHRLDGTADNVIAKADSADGTTLKFTVPASGPSGVMCVGVKPTPGSCVGISAMMTAAGEKKVSVSNSNGASNVVVFTVTK